MASSPTPCAELTFSDLSIPPSVPMLPESGFSGAAFTAPLRTFQTVPNGFDFQDPACAPDELFYICWPTVAPSSLDFYDADSAGITRDRAGHPTSALENPGAILEFRYTG